MFLPQPHKSTEALAAQPQDVGVSGTCLRPGAGPRRSGSSPAADRTADRGADPHG